MADPNTELLKQRKDALVSALFSLSKAAQETSSATIDFFNSLGTSDNATIADALNSIVLAVGSLGDLGTTVAHASANKQQVISQVPSATTAGIKRAVTYETQPVISGSTEEIPAVVKRKRSKRAAVDPDAPKKPTTVYFAFASEARKLIREDREKNGLEPLTNSEMTQETATRWNALSENERTPWRELYKQQLEKYNQDRLAYLQKKQAYAQLTATVEDVDQDPIGQHHHQQHSQPIHHNGSSDPSFGGFTNFATLEPIGSMDNFEVSSHVDIEGVSKKPRKQNKEKKQKRKDQQQPH